MSLNCGVFVIINKHTFIGDRVLICTEIIAGLETYLISGWTLQARYIEAKTGSARWECKVPHISSSPLVQSMIGRTNCFETRCLSDVIEDELTKSEKWSKKDHFFALRVLNKKR